MKRHIVTLASLLAVSGFAIFTMVPKVEPSSTAVALAAPTPAGLAVPVPSRCPNIHHAAEALEAAMRDMEKADHDFCGHKEEAMRAAGRALEQLRRAEECDRCR